MYSYRNLRPANREEYYRWLKEMWYTTGELIEYRNRLVAKEKLPLDEETYEFMADFYEKLDNFRKEHHLQW